MHYVPNLLKSDSFVLETDTIKLNVSLQTVLNTASKSINQSIETQKWINLMSD